MRGVVSRQWLVGFEFVLEQLRLFDPPQDGVWWLTGVKNATDPLHAMLAGSFMVGVFFYATDPVSASQTNEGRWLYGAFIGVLSSLISVFSAWPAGTMFSILLANMFAPITDYGIRALKSRRQAAGGGAQAKAGP